MNADKKKYCQIICTPSAVICTPVLHVDFANIPLGFCLWNQQLSPPWICEVCHLLVEMIDMLQTKTFLLVLFRCILVLHGLRAGSLPSIGVVIMLNCCFSKSICMFSTMIKFCITKKYIFKYYKPILWLRLNNLSSVYQLFYNFSCSYTYSFKW